MRRIKARFLFLTALILLSSLVVLAYAQENDLVADTVSTSTPASWTISTPLAVGTLLNKSRTQLNQPTRCEVYEFIEANPGVHFRGICQVLDLPVGVTQYHLDVLMKARLISCYQDGRYTRFFQFGKYGEIEMQAISLLRHTTARKILSILVEKPSICHSELASTLGISSQALTWHKNRLAQTDFITFRNEGMKVRYSLSEVNAELIKQYFKSI